MLPDVISHDELTSGPGRAGRFQRRVDRGRDGRLRARRDHAHAHPRGDGLRLVDGGRDASPSRMPRSRASSISFSVVPAALIGLSLLTLTRYRLRRTDIDRSPEIQARTGWNSVPRRKLKPPARRRAPVSPTAKSPTAREVRCRRSAAGAPSVTERETARRRDQPSSASGPVPWSHLTLGQRARLIERLHATVGRQRRGMGRRRSPARRASSPDTHCAARSGSAGPTRAGRARRVSQEPGGSSRRAPAR